MEEKGIVIQRQFRVGGTATCTLSHEHSPAHGVVRVLVLLLDDLLAYQSCRIEEQSC